MQVSSASTEKTKALSLQCSASNLTRNPSTKISDANRMQNQDGPFFVVNCFSFLAKGFRTHQARCFPHSDALQVSSRRVQSTVMSSGKCVPVFIYFFACLRLFSRSVLWRGRAAFWTRCADLLECCVLVRILFSCPKGTLTAFFLGHSGLALTCLIKEVKFSDLAVFKYMCSVGRVEKCVPLQHCREKLKRVCYIVLPPRCF